MATRPGARELSQPTAQLARGRAPPLPPRPVLATSAGTVTSSTFLNTGTLGHFTELEGFYLKIAFRDGFLLDPELKVLNLPVGQKGNEASEK